jgi:hypothetical protein
MKDSYTRRVVHGFAQHTVFRKDCIATRVPERWPDQIGSVNSTRG